MPDFLQPKGDSVTVTDANGLGGVTATVREDEPIKASPKVLRGMAGRLNGLFGPAMLPEQREKERERRKALLVRMAQTRFLHRTQHAWAVTKALQHRTNAAMCATCPKASADGLTCTATNEPIRVMLTVSVERQGTPRRELLGEMLACPLGRHSKGSRAVVRWMGVRWFGVPEPLRWLVDWNLIKYGRRPTASTLAGCGCAVPLRLLSARRGWGWLNALDLLPKARAKLAKWWLDRKARPARMAAWSSSPQSSQFCSRSPRSSDAPNPKSSAHTASSQSTPRPLNAK